METGKENREHLNNLRSLKATVPVSKPLGARRPALGDVGNKIIRQESLKNVKAKPTITKTESVQITKKTTTRKLNSESELAKVVHKTKVTQIHAESVVEKTTDKDEGCSYSTMQLAVVIDPDANDKGNPFLLAEYVQDIFSYLRELESKYEIHKGFLSSHRSTANMRKILVNWMIEVTTNFKFLQETLHLTIGILDRYLQLDKTIGTEILQLVGVTAIMIASKYEEIMMPDLGDFAYVCDNCFTHFDILHMELEILKKLEFNLGRPLSLHFLRRYHKIAHVRPQEHNLAKYFLEICLLEYELCHVNPSVQAAAACCLSLSILNDEINPAKVWTESLVSHSTYKYSEIKPVVLNLTYFLAKLEKSKYQAIRNKYSKANVGKISCHPKLHGRVVQKLLEEAQIFRASLTKSN